MKRKGRKKVFQIGTAVFLCSISLGNAVKAETYEYDKMNRLTKVTYDNGQSITYEYDANGNIKNVKKYIIDSPETEEKPDDSENNNQENSNQNNEVDDSSDDNKAETENKTETDNKAESNNKPDSDNGTNTDTEQSENGKTEQPKEEKTSPKIVKTKKANYVIYYEDKLVTDVQLIKFKDKKAKAFTVPNTITYKGMKYKVTSIGDKAFYKMTKLQKVTIGKNIKRIGKKAFWGDKKLKTIIVRSSKLTKVDSQALKKTNKSLKVKAPSKKLKKYKKLFKNKGNKTLRITK